MALNDSSAAKAYQQAMFQQDNPAAMFYTDDLQVDYERIQACGAEFTLPPTEAPWGSMARLEHTAAT